MRISDIHVRWREKPQLDSEAGGWVSLQLFKIYQQSMQITAEPERCFRYNSSTKRYDSMYHPYESSQTVLSNGQKVNNPLGVQAKITLWSDKSMFYNVYFEDIDQPNRFEFPSGTNGNVDVCKWDTGAWMESVYPNAKYDSNVYTESNTTLTVMGGNTLRGTKEVNDSSEKYRGSFHQQYTLGTSVSDTAAFTWRGSCCTSYLLDSLTYDLKLAVNKNSTNARKGGTLTAYTTKFNGAQNGAVVTGSTTDSGGGWQHRDMLSKNDYKVVVKPETGYYITGVWVDGEKVTSNQYGTYTYTGSVLKGIKADHQVSATFELIPVGGLKVTKTVADVEGADLTKKFTFAVTLKDSSGKAVSGTYGGVTFTNGQATFQLGNGESKTLDGIQAGYKYTISEKSPGKYQAKWTGNTTGTIVKDNTINLTCTNTFIVDPVGSLNVKKVITGGETDPFREKKLDREFTFTVTVTNNGTPVTGDYGLVLDANGKATFTLGNGDDQTLSGLPAGASYTVAEAADADFDTTWQNQTGTIAEDTEAQVTCTNTMKQVPLGSLSVKKVVNSTDESHLSQRYDFAVKLSVPGEPPAPATGTYDGVEFDENGKATFTLGNGESKVINSIPKGYIYEVSEDIPADDWQVAWEGQSGTIGDGTTTQVTCTNTPPTVVEPRIEITAVKSSDPVPGTPRKVGEEIAYTVRVTNVGEGAATNVGVFDPVPDGTVCSALPDEFGASLTENQRGIGWIIPELAAGQSTDVHFTVKVIDEELAKNAGVVRNQATYDLDVSEAPTEDLERKTNIVEHPLLPPQIQTGKQVTAYKDSDPAPNSVVKAGQEITYIIRLRHTGVNPQPATIVRDYIPTGTSFIDGAIDNDGVYVAADKATHGRAYVEWVLGEMKPGDERDVRFKVRVDENPPSLIRNLAIYQETDPGTKPGDPTTPDPELKTNEVWHTTNPEVPTPEVVQVVKASDSVPGTTVKVGDTIKYTLHVTNTGGSDAINYGVHDRLQDGLELVDGSVTASANGEHTIKSLYDALKNGFQSYDNASRDTAWTIDKIAPNETIDLTFSVKVVKPVVNNVIQNQATWGKRGGGDDIPTDSQENTSNIVEHPLLLEPKPVITKVALTRNTVKTGDTVEFLVTVKNEGNADLVNHVLVDTPGEGLEYLSDNKGGTKEGKNARWKGITLKPGEQFQVNVKCKVTATKAGRLTNVATLYRPDGQKLVALANAEATVMVGVAADIVQTGAKTALLVGMAAAVATAGLAAFLVHLRKRGA